MWPCERAATLRADSPLRGGCACRHVDDGRPVTASSASMRCGRPLMLSRSGLQHAAVIPRNHLEVPMNEYGRRALEHWLRTKPQELATMPDRVGFFSTLGETVASQVDELTDQLAGPDSPTEGFLGKVGRLRAAKAQAEEMVLGGVGVLDDTRGPRRRGGPGGGPGGRDHAGPGSAGDGGAAGVPAADAGRGGSGLAGPDRPEPVAGPTFRPDPAGQLTPSGDRARASANLEAIRLSQQLTGQNRPATLRGTAGAGGLVELGRDPADLRRV